MRPHDVPQPHDFYRRGVDHPSPERADAGGVCGRQPERGARTSWSARICRSARAAGGASPRSAPSAARFSTAPSRPRRRTGRAGAHARAARRHRTAGFRRRSASTSAQPDAPHHGLGWSSARRRSRAVALDRARRALAHRQGQSTRRRSMAAASSCCGRPAAPSCRRTATPAPNGPACCRARSSMAKAASDRAISTRPTPISTTTRPSRPVADCVCLVALTGHIAFHGWLGRMLQPFVRI